MTKIKLSVEGDDSIVPSGFALLEISVPFPRGLVASPSELVLRDEVGQQVDAEWSVTARWLDGSIRFARTDTVVEECPSELELHVLDGRKDVKPNQSTLKGQTGAKAQEASAIEGLKLDIRLASGEDLSIVQSQCDVIANRTTSASGILSSEPTRSSELEWQLQRRDFVDCDIIYCKLTLRNPRRATHPNGIWEVGDPNSVQIEYARIDLDAPSLFSLAGNIAATNKDQSTRWTEDGESWNETDSDLRLTQYGSGSKRFNGKNHPGYQYLADVPSYGYVVSCGANQEFGSQANPAVAFQLGEKNWIGVSPTHFWQVFPKALSVSRDKISYELFPKIENASHELQPGEQTTFDFWILHGEQEDIEKRVASLKESRSVRVDPDWIAKTQVVPWLLPRSEDLQADYLAQIDHVVEGDGNFFHKREHVDQYGWRNFGDVWGDHEAIHSDPEDPFMSHYNNQYDMVLGFGLNYLRGGDRRWLELMQDQARHTIDIDIYHTDEDRASFNHGMFWHTVHYVDAGKSCHRTYPAGTCGGGPSSGHAYARGLMLYYCMTGDQTAKEAVIKMGDWMIASEDGSKTKYRWFAGGETGLTSASGTEVYHGPGRGPGNCVEVLVTAFELTHDRKYLEQAEKIIRRVSHPDQDITQLDLLDAENKWFYTLFLQALGRYLEVKLQADEIDEMYSYGRATLLHFAEWMKIHEYPYLSKAEKLEFPTETWAAQEMRKVEVFQWAARHAAGEIRDAFLERAAYFYTESLNRLDGFETRYLCRPQALLLTSGYSHAWFRNGGLDSIPESPVGPGHNIGPTMTFEGQKTRAIRNVKRTTVAIGVAMVIALGFALWQLI